MDKNKWLKECSASTTTDVEAASKKSKREFDDSVILLLKKQKKEIDELTSSLKLMSEVIKTLQDNSVTKADLEDILLKVKETTNKKVEPECGFETSGAEGNNQETILVKGFDCSFPRDDIKSSLEKRHYLKDYLKDFCETSGGRRYRIPDRYTNLFLIIKF
ncbi:hypothetical protein CARUB_v10002088mg [Capsella rubella]|uniref:Uncharacterized protein n=1 Tax=Capsella rubella TaxID=81985 RepID=R0HD54_9BRAS|nr:hypothetical protein CARUB_v10002088mg [Capsella rubella]